MPTLESLLAGRNTTRLVQNVKSGLPFVLPVSFLTPTDPMVPGHTFEYPLVTGSRALATIVSQDSPAHRIGHQGVSFQSANMLRSFESQAFNANKLRNLVQVESQQVRDQMGRAFVERNVLDFKQRQMNLVQTAAASMLLRFALHFNEKGALLTSSSGAVVSIDPGIPAGQLNQLNILGGGAIIDNSWAVTSTDIIGDIDEIKRQMLKLGGWQMRYAFHGKNIPAYIGANTVAKEYIDRTPALASQRFTGANVIPDGFQDLTWINASNMYYIDADGSPQDMLGGDEIVFCPEPSPEWWKLAYGSEMIPTDLGRVGGDATDMLGNLTEVFGSFVYSVMNMSPGPIGLEMFHGINFLPLIAATKAVCKADVTP